MKPSAKAPRSCDSVARTASTGLTPFFEHVVDEMQHDLGVGLGLEDRALLLQRLAQLAEILDDAVVDDGDALGRMRMRVVLGRLAVGGPAGVADAGVAGERLGFEPGFQILQLAFGAAAIELLALQRRDAGGVVAAIFEPLERIHQLLRDRSASQNADNAAHAVKNPKSTRDRNERATFLTKMGRVEELNNCCVLRQG